jgi:hypothetical protein
MAVVQNLKHKNLMEEELKEGRGFPIPQVDEGSKGGSLGPHEEELVV